LGSSQLYEGNSLQARERLARDPWPTFLVTVVSEDGGEEQRDDLPADRPLVADRAVGDEQGGAASIVEEAPAQRQVDGGISATEVDPVDDAAETAAVDEHVAEVQVTVTGCGRRRGGNRRPAREG
jgi:hypothetical protein